MYKSFENEEIHFYVLQHFLSYLYEKSCNKGSWISISLLWTEIRITKVATEDIEKKRVGSLKVFQVTFKKHKVANKWFRFLV